MPARAPQPLLSKEDSDTLLPLLRRMFISCQNCFFSKCLFGLLMLNLFFYHVLFPLAFLTFFFSFSSMIEYIFGPIATASSITLPGRCQISQASPCIRGADHHAADPFGLPAADELQVEAVSKGFHRFAEHRGVHQFVDVGLELAPRFLPELRM